MDETVLMVTAAIALAPIYGFVIWAMWSHSSYQIHILRRIDESTKKTELTETITDSNGKVLPKV